MWLANDFPHPILGVPEIASKTSVTAQDQVRDRFPAAVAGTAPTRQHFKASSSSGRLFWGKTKSQSPAHLVQKVDCFGGEQDMILTVKINLTVFQQSFAKTNSPL